MNGRPAEADIESLFCDLAHRPSRRGRTARTFLAVSTDETRGNRNGVYFEPGQAGDPAPGLTSTEAGGIVGTGCANASADLPTP